MTKKLSLRYEKTWYEEPPKPKAGEKRFRIEDVISVSDRVNHFPGAGGDESSFYECEYEEPEETPEYTGDLGARHSISLKKLNDLVQKHGLNEKDVYITASMSEDYLCVEAVHIRKLTAEETQEEYQEQLKQWQKQNKRNNDYEVERAKQDLELAQKRLESLTK